MAASLRAENNDTVVVWEPQPGPQTALVTCPVFEVFYGGARGGGKTDGMLGDWISHAGMYGSGANGIMLRRTRVELKDTIRRSGQIFSPIGAKYNDQKHIWSFPNGAHLTFAYLERDKDAQAYQGHSYSRVYFEELGNFPSPEPVMKMMATLRSGSGVPVGFRSSGNPGGPGHNWVKERYITPAPLGWQIITSEFINPFDGTKTMRDRIYIPSRLSDNKYLGADYVANLQMSGSQQLVKAWLEGNWDIVEGAYFNCFSIDRHVIAPIEIPKNWTRFRAMDWGSARPFSVQWFAISDGTLPGLPKNALVMYREWYGASGPNVGLKMTAEEVAAGIAAKERGETISYGVCDPAMYQQDGGPSIAERMSKGAGIKWRPADNKRLPGWDQVRARLVGEDEKPALFFFSTCTNIIRTLPALQHDDVRPEDLDSEGEDHSADALRYACMSRPYIRPVQKKALTRAEEIEDLKKKLEAAAEAQWRRKHAKMGFTK